MPSAQSRLHYAATVVTVSYYSGAGSALHLGEEWHHTRLNLRDSMPVWGNPSCDYPLWDVRRLEETVWRLMRDKKLTSEGMLDPVFPFKKAEEAYQWIDQHPELCVKLGISYN